MRQEFGRAGRAGQKGEARLILRRSEFAAIMDPDKLGTSKEAVHAAIEKLNELRYQERLKARVHREEVDELKHIIQYSGFQQIIGILRNAGIDARGILVTSRDFIAAFDEEFGKLQLSHQAKVKHIITWMSNKWQTDFPKLAEAYSKINLSQFETLSEETIVAYMAHRFPEKPEAPRVRIEKGLPTPEIDDVTYYIQSSPESINTSELKTEDLNRFVQKYRDILDRQSLYPVRQAEALDKKVACIVKGLSHLNFNGRIKDNALYLFVEKIKFYGDKHLIAAMMAARQTYFNTLTSNFETDALRKTKFLLASEAKWQKCLPEEMKAIKTDCFHSWWETQKSQFNQYHDPSKWAEVSKATKELVSDSMSAIKEINEPGALLGIIAFIKLTLLQDASVSTHSPSLSSSLEGPLFKMVLDMEERVVLATPANKLDAVISLQLRFINILCQQLKSQIPAIPMLEIFDNKFNSHNVDLQTQYDACQLLILKMQSMPETDPLLENEDLRTFKKFCHTESARLANFIALCDEHKALNETGSVYQYRAASQLAADIPQIGKAAGHSALFSYQAKPFAIPVIDDSTLEQQPWIEDINTAENYQRLFANLEEQLMIDNPDLKCIIFEAPELTMDMIDPNIYYLTINAQLDDKKLEFKYIFDLQQKKVLLYNIESFGPSSQTQLIFDIAQGVALLRAGYASPDSSSAAIVKHKYPSFFAAAEKDKLALAQNKVPNTPK